MTDTTIADCGKCTVYVQGMFGYRRVECRKAALLRVVVGFAARAGFL